PLNPAFASEDQVWNTLVAADKNDWPTVGTTSKEVSDPAVHGWHAYSFMGTKLGPNGERLVTLRNPWGFSPGNDGVVDVPLASFMKNFPTLAWVELPKAPS